MPSHTLSMSIMITATVIMFALFMLLLIPCSRGRPYSLAYLKPIQKYGSIACVLLSILCSLFDIAHIESSIHVELDFDSTSITVMADVAFFSSSLLLYIIFFHRISEAFHNTAYELSRRYTVFLWIIMSIYCIHILIYVLLIATHQYTDITYYAIFMSMEFIISIALLVGFVYKLREVILMQVDAALYEIVPDPIEQQALYSFIELTSMSHGSMSGQRSTIDSSEFKLDSKQVDMITLITKMTLLSIIAIVGAEMFWISIMIVVAECDVDCDVPLMEGYIYGLRAFLLTVKSIVLYLSFDFNASIYSKWCKLCHMACYQCCASRMEKAIEGRQLTTLITQASDNYRIL
eukprot:56162_1